MPSRHGCCCAEDPRHAGLPAVDRAVCCISTCLRRTDMFGSDAGLIMSRWRRLMISIHYDPMLAKLIVWDRDRETARRRLAAKRWGQEMEISRLANQRRLPWQLFSWPTHPAFAAAEVDNRLSSIRHKDSRRLPGLLRRFGHPDRGAGLGRRQVWSPPPGWWARRNVRRGQAARQPRPIRIRTADKVRDGYGVSISMPGGRLSGFIRPAVRNRTWSCDTAWQRRRDSGNWISAVGAV